MARPAPLDYEEPADVLTPRIDESDDIMCTCGGCGEGLSRAECTRRAGPAIPKECVHCGEYYCVACWQSGGGRMYHASGAYTCATCVDEVTLGSHSLPELSPPPPSASPLQGRQYTLAVMSSRAFAGYETFCCALDAFGELHGRPRTIVPAGSRRGIAMARRYAAEHTIAFAEPPLPPADWQGSGPAPSRRNYRQPPASESNALVVQQADALIAFRHTKSRATANMLKLARDASNILVVKDVFVG